MAQRAIREYDAKRMFANFSSSVYRGYLIQSKEDIDIFAAREAGALTTWVIKPDQLFGKRGKYGLIGVNLDTQSIRKWWIDHDRQEATIGQQDGLLTTFLIEPFVPHTSEYYVAIKTERDHDVIYFSNAGGIEVEENWETVQDMRVPLFTTYPIGSCHPGGMVARDLDSRETESRFLHTQAGQKQQEGELIQQLNITDSRVSDFIIQLYQFFREYGFAYLEVNPFTFATDGSLVCLDMVARVDDSEEFRQRKNWTNLIFPHPFGPEKTNGEKYIEKLDSETGASLKFRILNPSGRIWLLTSGGGASVIIADTLADLGYASEIGNYGECSGNPDRENTRAYTATLLDAMLANPTPGKYLVIAGAIANFTHIDRTFAGVIDAFRDRISDMRTQDVHILVRRGGIHDTKGLAMMQKACEELHLPCEIADGSQYMTDILKNIKL